MRRKARQESERRPIASTITVSYHQAKAKLIVFNSSSFFFLFVWEGMKEGDLEENRRAKASIVANASEEPSIECSSQWQDVCVPTIVICTL